MRTKLRCRWGFTLVELLVVIGIIGLLIAMLLPALQKAQAQAKWVRCKSNLHQVGIYLQIYANQWRGACYPPLLGDDHPETDRWPVYVFKPAVYNPPVLICPSDIEPGYEHSYILNAHLGDKGIKFSSRDLGGLSPSDVVLMGEKTSVETDYYMDAGDYPAGMVELYRHGFRVGSNYLYLDTHVESFRRPGQLLRSLDPWEVKTDKDPVPNQTAQ